MATTIVLSDIHKSSQDLEVHAWNWEPDRSAQGTTKKWL